MEKELRCVLGMLAGGSYCDETVTILQRMRLKVYSNSRVGSRIRLRGRPHYPMFDLRLNRDKLLETGKGPTSAVILFDVFLGHGS